MEAPEQAGFDASRVRRAVVTVAALNFSYFFIEFTVALSSGSVSLMADSVDFLEDTSISLLIYLALGWTLAKRAAMGKVMAFIILMPAAFAASEAVQHMSAPAAPDVLPILIASAGAIVINGTSAVIMSRVRRHGGSLGRAAYLSARNDVAVNIAIILMGLLTAWLASGWPDIILGSFIILLALHSAREVWQVSEEERLAARALAGDIID